MKKRLSSQKYLVELTLLVGIGFFVIFTYLSRTISLSWDLAHVDLEIPVYKANHLNAFHGPATKHRTHGAITDLTPTIILSDSALEFGPLRNFTQPSAARRSVFNVPHEDRRPMIHKALAKIKLWYNTIPRDSRDKSAKIALFVPSEEWPVAIIIQLVQHMKESGPFERVILGSGFHSDGA